MIVNNNDNNDEHGNDDDDEHKYINTWSWKIEQDDYLVEIRSTALWLWREIEDDASFLCYTNPNSRAY